MSGVISRNHKSMVWQCINWKFLIRYTVNLKSRLYKAFLDKSKKRIYQLQSILINSQVFTIVALKNSINCRHFQNNSFELGYIIFCLYNAIDIDLHFFYFYRQVCVLDLNIIVEDLIDQVKYLIFGWLLESYNNYLFYVNSLYYSRLYKLDSLFNISVQKLDLSGYALYLNLESCVNYIDLPTFINKLYLIPVVKLYCFKFLKKGIFSTLLLYLDSTIDYKVLRKCKSTLFIQILNISILQVSYEIIFMFVNSFNYSIDNIKNIVLIHDMCDLFIISKKPCDLRIWNDNLNNFLLCNGIYVDYNQELFPMSLIQGINYGQLFITSSQYGYPFYYMIKPSLHDQFNLVKRVSIVLMQSRSQPLFLLIVRLNMLLLTWLNYYVNQPIKKVLVLLDSLICMKFRLSITGAMNKYFSKIKLSDGYRSVVYFNCVWRKSSSYVVVMTKNSKLYRYYFLVRLSWLYKLKCQINLRGAI